MLAVRYTIPFVNVIQESMRPANCDEAMDVMEHLMGLFKEKPLCSQAKRIFHDLNVT